MSTRANKRFTQESLLEKLERLLPGARAETQLGTKPEESWCVRRGAGKKMKTLATGASMREAIDRAIFLWVQR